MKKKGNEKELLVEFQQFLRVPPKALPQSVEQHILQAVKRELFPSTAKVLWKLFVVHLFSGAVSLSFCPQLGFSRYAWFDLMGGLMSLGEIPCAIACGSLFLGLSMVVAAFLLRPEEIRVAQSKGFFTLSLLCVTSYAGLMLLGGEAGLVESLFWLLGALLGGFLGLEMVPKIKRALLSPQS